MSTGSAVTMDSISQQQQDTLEKFRENLKDVLKPQHDDAMLVRFLKARNFDLKKSSDMLRKHLEWYDKWKVETILKDHTPNELLDNYYGGGVVGYDKDGDVIIIDNNGLRDWKGLLCSAKTSELMKYAIWRREMFGVALENQSQKIGRHARIVTIADMEGMGPQFLWKPSLDFLKAASTMLEENYPETLKIIYLVNVPYIFHRIYHLTKFIMKEEVRQKLRILGSNWKEEILQYMDADQLPVHWGGTKTGPDGDPKCLHIMGAGYGQKIPQSYYLKSRELNGDQCVTHSIGRGSALKLEYNVTTPKSFLRYEFKTKHYDLAFSVWRKNSDGSKVTILEKQRYNCHLVPEDGQLTLEAPGKYFVEFDNSYSMLRRKSLIYCIEIVESSEDDEGNNN